MKTSHPFLSCLILLLLSCFPVFGIDYYVDSVGGNDSNGGTSQSLPWKTIDKVNNVDLNPGDTVNLKAGSSFTVGDYQTVLLLMSGDSGSSTAPVTIRSYGSGAKPLLYQSYSSSRNSAVLGFYGGVSNVVIDGLHLKGVNGNASPTSGRNGVDVVSTALLANGATNTNITIRNCEIEGGCRGMLLYRCVNFNVLNNYFHDITGINANTPTSVNNDDDSGAEVIDLNTYCENIYIAGNTVANCSYISYDYGIDGAFIEVYGTYFKSITVCNNVATNMPGGTVEMGSPGGGTVDGFDFHHNLITEACNFYTIHKNGSYGMSDIFNINFNNNTFIQGVITDDNLRPWTIFDVNGVVTDATKVKVQNNIFYLKTGTKNNWNGGPASNMSSIYGNDDTFTHKYNLYYHAPGAGGRFLFAIAPDSTEKVGLDPLFTDNVNGNFTLASGSPAMDAGTVLGYTVDLAGITLYSGAAPDMGAYERTSGSVSQATIVGSTAGAEQSGNYKTQAYDNNVDTRWCNDGTLPNAWIQFDLGATYNVSQVSLMLENNHLLTYPIRIQVGDGTTFTDAFVGSTSLAGWKQYQDFAFTPKSGRYIRVSMTAPNSSGATWFSIWEIRAYYTGSAPTPSQTTIVGSSAGAEQTGNYKAQAYDNNVDTRWCNDGTLANGWIQFDLGATYNVSQVSLILENNHIITYPIKIQVGDGTTFTDAFTGSTSLVGWKQYQDFTFAPKSGRYVRVSMTASNSQGFTWFSIWEAKIYRIP